MIDIVMDKACDLNALNNDKKSPFILAMKNDNIKVLKKLSANIRISESPQLLFEFESKVFED